MPANKSQVRFLITCLAVAWGFFATVSQVFADWSGPTSAPPEGNPSPFVSTDSTSQTKTGSLTIGTNFYVNGSSNILGSLGLNMTPSTTVRLVVDPISNASIDAGTGAVRSGYTALAGSDLINKAYLDSTSLNYWLRSGNNLYTTSTITNVGIGTTSPTSKLHLVNTKGGDGTWTGGLTIENTGATAGEAAVTYKNISTGANRWFTGLNQSDSFNVAYGAGFTNDNSKIRILANGNVGIGTTNPGQKLDVAGVIKSTSAVTQTAPFITSNTSVGASGIFAWVYEGLTPNIVNNSGSLFLLGKAKSKNNSAHFDYVHVSDGSLSNRFSVGMYNNDNLLNILASGNVGIGTTNPGSKLEVSGSASGTTGVNLNAINTNATGITRFKVTNSSGASAMMAIGGVSYSGGGGALYQNNALFSTDNSLYFLANHNTATGGVGIINFTTGGYNNNPTLTVTAGNPGNVGIGTTNPGAYKLAVNGTANFTGQVTVPTPTATSSAANKSYVDSVALGAQNALWNLNGSSLRPSSTAWNVAIGTTSTPDAKLQVAGSFHVSGSANSVKLDKLAGTGGRIVMTDAEGNLYATSTSVATGIAVGTTGQTLRHDGTSWVANSFLYNNGTNIGIGTTNPSSTLDVAGTINGTHLKINNNIALNTGSNFLYINVGRNFSSGTYMEGSLAIQTGDIYSYTNEASSLGKTTNYWNNLYVKNGIFKNTVTVGSTSSAVAALDVYGGNVLINDAAITSATPKAAITKTYLDSALSAFNTSTNLWASSAAGIYNVGLGNVLIGTTSPATHKLYVQGNTYLKGTTHSAGNLSTSGTFSSASDIYTTGAGDDFWLGNGTQGSANFRAYATGETHIDADNIPLSFGEDQDADIYYDATNLIINPRVVGTGNTIFNAGNVGIGTTSNTIKLAVNGSGYFLDPVVVGTPTAAGHATTKSYVDGMVTGSYWRQSGNNLYASTTDWNVGVGTTTMATGKLNIQGNVAATGSYLSGNGSASAPAYSFLSDTNTGMYRGNTDVLRLVTAGTDRVTIDASGNVGVGSASPKVRLQSSGSSGAAIPALGVAGGGLYLTSVNANYGLLAGVISTGKSWIQAQRTDTTATAYDLLLQPNDGNVGVASTSPVAKLGVDGTGHFSGTVSVAPPVGDNDAVTKSYLFSSLTNDSFWKLSGDKLYASSTAWKVGIGTSSPSEMLEVVGKVKISKNTISAESITFNGDAATGMRLENTYGYINLTPLNGGWAHIYTDRNAFIFNKPVYSGANIFSSYDGDLQLRRTGTTKINAGSTTVTVADSLSVNGTGDSYFTGDLGIGSSTPNYKLAVNGSGHFSNTVAVASPTNSEHAVNLGYLTSTLAYFNTNTNLWRQSGNNLYASTTDWNVGVGTTTMATGKLNIQGNVAATGSYLSGNGSASAPAYSFLSDTNTGMYRGGTDILRFSTAGADRMTILANGTVGIGNTSPSAGKLQIYGEGEAQGLNIASSTGDTFRIYRKNNIGYVTRGGNDLNGLSIKTDGSVGIASTSPNYKLAVNGGGYFLDPVVVGTPTAAGHAATKSYVDGMASAAQNALWGLNGNNLYASSTAWKVGVGTSSPDKKVVIQLDDAAGVDEFKIVDSAGVNAFNVDSDGNVLFGAYPANVNFNNANVTGMNNVAISDGGPKEGMTWADSNWSIDTSPLDRSNTTGNLNFYGTANNIAFWRPSLWVYNASNYTTATARSDGGLNFTTTGSGDITFNPGASGFVGIGTTDPGYNLDVNGSARFTGQVTVPTPTATTSAVNRAYVDTNFAPLAGAASLWSTSTAGTYNTGLGNVMIATTTMNFSRLNVQGGVAATGGFYTGNGSASAPAYSFLSDTNTGMYRGGTDILRFSTAGADRMTILANGNVGIGTSNPGAKLNLYSTTDSTLRLQLRASGAGRLHGVIDFWGTSDSRAKIDAYAEDSDWHAATALRFFTGAVDAVPTEKARITSTGNVGINTTSPQSKLAVNGLIKMPYYTIGAPEDVVNVSYLNSTLSTFNTNNNLWKLNGNDLYASSTAWNIGVGTANPGSKLSVVYASDTVVPALGSNGGAFSMLGGNGGYGLVSGVLGSGNVYLQAQRVDGGTATYGLLLNPSGGRVGINNSAPAHDLHIGTNGSGSLAIANGGGGPLIISGNSSDGIARINNSNSGFGAIQFQSRGVDTVRIDNSGNMVIGTTTALAKFHVQSANNQQIVLTGSTYGGGSNQRANIGFSDAGSNYLTLSTGYAGSGTSIIFSPGTVEAMRAVRTAGGDGFLAVGTTSMPQTRIDLGGGSKARISGLDTDPAAVRGDSDAVPKKWIVDNFAPVVGTASLWSTSTAGTYNTGLGNVMVGTTTMTGGKLNVNGDINVSGGFKINNAAASGNYLRGNGARFVASTILDQDLSSNIYNLNQTYGYHGHGSDIGDGWKTISSLVLNSRCQSARIFGEYQDLGYGSAARYTFNITGRAECDFETNNESHNLKMVYQINSNTNLNFDDKFRLVRTNNAANSITYELQVYVTTWNVGSWVFRKIGNWTIYNAPQVANSPLADSKVVKSSFLNVNDGRIRAGGVSINTTTTSFGLAVNGTGHFSNTVSVASPTNSDHAVNLGYLTSTLAYFNESTNLWKLSGNNLYSSSTAWNVGIGTNSPFMGKLHINASGASTTLTAIPTANQVNIAYGYNGVNSWIFREAYAANNWGLFHNNDVNTFDFVGANLSRLHLDLGTGSIGIASTSPTAKLAVNGNVKFDSGNFSTDGAGNITAESFLDRSNVTYKLDPSNTGTSLNVAGIIAASGSGNNYLAGNLGLGIASPSSKFHVNGGDIKLADTAGATPFTIKSFSNGTSLWLIGGSTTSNSLILADAHSWDRTVNFKYTPGTTGAASGILRIGQLSKNADTYTHGSTAFYTNGLERMRIIANGGVGINTTNPGGHKLNVNGSANFTGQVTVPTPTATSSAVNKDYVDSMVTGSYWRLSGNNLYASTTNWNVGVGTNNPGVKFEVANSAREETLNSSATINIVGNAISSRTDTSVQDILRLHQPNTASTNSKGSTFAIGLSFPDDPGNNYPRTRVDFKTTGRTTDNANAVNTVMSLMDSGYVGIGTTNPSSTLDIANNIKLTSGGTIYSAAPDRWLDFSGTIGDSLKIYANINSTNGVLTTSGTGNNYMAGNLGLGIASPVAKLQVNGGMVLKRTEVGDTNYTALATDYIIAFTSLSAQRTLTLPTALCGDTNAGRVFVVVNETGSNYSVSIDPEGNAKIAGFASIELPKYNSTPVYCNGSGNWFIY